MLCALQYIGIQKEDCLALAYSGHSHEAGE